MSKQNQHGSIHAIAVVAVMILFVGALVFLYWKNFVSSDASVEKDINAKQESSNTDSSKQESMKVKLKTFTVDASFPAPLSWTYPETWNITGTGGGPSTDNEPATQSTILRSPSGKYEVSYLVGVNGGRGGTCDRDSSGTVEHIIQKSIPGLSSGRFVEFIGNNGDSEGYFYVSGITDNNQYVRAATIGTSNCFYGLGGTQLEKEHTYDLLSAQIRIKELTNEDGYAKIIQNKTTITNLFNTDEYRQAVSILLSTKLGM